MLSDNEQPANGSASGKHNGVLPDVVRSSSAAFDRQNPFAAPLLRCTPLTTPASEKDVRFAAFTLKGSGLKYEVGDALGVYPENDPELVESILELLGARGDEVVTFPNGRFVHSFEALLRDFNITRVGEGLVGLLATQATDPLDEQALKSLLQDDPDSVLESADVLDLLQMFPSARPTILDLIASLSPLQPRLYSISSSLKAHPDEVHLTIGVVRYQRGDRLRKGVASNFITDTLRPRQKARVFVQTSHGFRLPADHDAPIIMVGPGTGIAPFRAFLEERQAVGAKGKNWLFFGDQRAQCDFLYRHEMDRFREQGLLTRLDTAFSRDQAQKVYVQHRMKENAAELFAWLQEGASFYVCGDARRMALDVDNALHAIVAEQGQLSPEAAKEHIKELTRTKRYQRDVY
jgi:sulfite reductase (NADPH) flavoprotein alpha-component